MEHFHEKKAYTVNKDATGHVRIWDLKDNSLILEAPNLITYQGADIAAKALSGQPFTSISHIYVGYTSGTTVPSVNLTDTIASFTNFARVPLSFSPSYANQTNYSNNLVYFTIYVTGSSSAGSGTTSVPNGDNIVELGLINATSGNPANDKLFSHISFNPIAYNSTYGIAITWGLTFVA